MVSPLSPLTQGMALYSMIPEVHTRVAGVDLD